MIENNKHEESKKPLSDQEVLRFMKEDFKHFSTTKNLKERIKKDPKFGHAKETKQASIIPFIGTGFARAAVIAILLSSGLLSFMISNSDHRPERYSVPQLADTSIHGFDTSFVKSVPIMKLN